MLLGELTTYREPVRVTIAAREWLEAQRREAERLKQYQKERFWEIDTKYPVPVTLDLANNKIRWVPEVCSYEAYQRIMWIVHENWFKKHIAPYWGASYAFKDGAGVIIFDKAAHAQAHYDLLKAAGVIE